MGDKIVKVCKKCSGFDVEDLKDILKSKQFSTGCIHKCKKKCPELEGKVYGYIKGDFTVCEKKKDFFEKIKSLL
ncbi:hypothetical protein acsn021_16300 [Anaerocolumna cellulosilytica]|uniref:Uncharacterized protein n=1 Tax=Anaerocolumna cellulosilytica TaxID=433286 RepID=A0A6S6R4Q0_9FIRM|nr:hypothetical protein [Anaerocolumna cellulosilytica]MBB5197254.1 hypothetical protein [Anaerocolumna cellulosilytica]BCJ94061.1 hypothetical protein acsn021_16300 [Anaerocolumna cellulosilytica]